MIYALTGFANRLIFECRASCHTAIWWLTTMNEQPANRILPIPPPRLRHRVHGGLDSRSFLSTGQAISQSLIHIIDNSELQNKKSPLLLDFGCGCGRSLRHFLSERKDWRFVATDIDAQAIDWNSRHLSGSVEWATNAVEPPLPYRSKSFDVILAISIFTHLDEKLQFAWLKEFQRLLTDTGIVITSIHGESVWESSDDWSVQIAQSGILHLHTNVGIRNFARTPAHYQTTLHSPDYIYSHWSQYFGSITVDERGIDGVQDAVILSQPR